MSYYIGTSGWAYEEWRSGFYPPGLKAGERLAYMAGHFNTVELNNTFYRLPSPSMMAKWAAAVPIDFRFAVKVWNEISHTRRLHDIEAEVAQFMASLQPLEGKRGPLLLQLPLSLTADAAPLLERAIALFTSHGAEHIAVEFRHVSWHGVELSNAAIVAHDMKRALDMDPAGAPFAYLRLHGPKGDYKGPYGADFLRTLADSIKKRAAADTYVFFNNTMTGDAPLEALALQKLLDAR